MFDFKHVFCFGVFLLVAVLFAWVCKALYKWWTRYSRVSNEIPNQVVTVSHTSRSYRRAMEEHLSMQFRRATLPYNFGSETNPSANRIRRVTFATTDDIEELVDELDLDVNQLCIHRPRDYYPSVHGHGSSRDWLPPRRTRSEETL